MLKNHKIEHLLLSVPGIFNYNTKLFFEVQPKRKSPIFVNIKNTLGNGKLRDLITSQLLFHIPSDIDLVCGIESGGSYYASVIAYKLRKPFVLYRKNDKKYAEKGNFVGTIPHKLRAVLIVDDVIVSGATIEPAIRIFRRHGCKIYVRTIFSYGHTNFITNRLALHIQQLVSMTSLLHAARQTNTLSVKDVRFLKGFITKQGRDFATQYAARKLNVT